MDNAELVSQLYRYFNQRDLEAAAALVSDSFEYVDVPFGTRHVGKAGLKEEFQGWLNAFPDGNIQVTRIISAGDFCVAEFVGRGTQTGVLETPGVDLLPTGRKVEVPFCEVWEARNGLLQSCRSYFDAATMLSQLGETALPTLREAEAAPPPEARPH